MKNTYFRKAEREIYLQEITSVRTKTLSKSGGGRLGSRIYLQWDSFIVYLKVSS